MAGGEGASRGEENAILCCVEIVTVSIWSRVQIPRCRLLAEVRKTDVWININLWIFITVNHHYFRAPARRRGRLGCVGPPGLTCL